MKRALGWIFNRWTLLTVLLLAASLTVWLFGPLVAVGASRPLDTVGSRLWTLAVLWLVVIGWALCLAWRSRRRNETVVKELVSAAPAVSDSADLNAVRERFERALQMLQRARFGEGGIVSNWLGRTTGRYLYELPWYLIIGAPGSGKTTALRHSGLKFPLADERNQGPALRGVGGTRNCDWFFTDSAVLIDTAGRFTTQDSDPQNDKATWSGFLQLLKRTRPRQPVNGVLVTVSVVDLFNPDLAQRAEHAAAVRRRLQELQEQLRIRFPIYLLVTKCDLLAGFMDSFGQLDREQRSTPWGFTFQAEHDSAAALAQMNPELQALQQRLNDGLIDRLQSESDRQRRARIYGFPAQFTALEPLLREFADHVFTPSPYEANPMLRGVYFVSGTQEGMPFDRLLGQVARQYRLERAVMPAHSGAGKAFFLERLLRDVIFAESGLAGTNKQWERRRGMLVAAGYGVLGLLTVGVMAAWGMSWSNNRQYVTDVARVTEQVAQQVANTPNRADSSLAPLLPALEATRKLALAGQAQMAGDACRGDIPLSLGFGLYQGCRLDQAARTTYERMLLDALQPRLALRIEEQLRQGDLKGSLYESLKAYLMLVEPARFDREALRQHLLQDWDVRLAGELNAEQRQKLDGHLEALLKLGANVQPVRPADRQLIEQTRAKLATIPLPQRIYDRLRRQGLGKQYPEFTVAAKGGAQAPLVFVRQGNLPLTSGVPGLYSFDGYHKGIQPRIEAVAKELASEQGWVLGVADAAANPAPNAANILLGSSLLEDQVRRLYLNEYAAAWEGFVNGIKLRPATNLAESIQLTRLLAAPDNPLVPLLRAVSRETTLLAPKSGLAGATGNVVEKALTTVNDAIGTKAPVATSGAPGVRIESIVDDRFNGIRQLVTAPEGGRAPIEAVLLRLNELHVFLTAVDSALKSQTTPPSSPLPNQMKAEAQTLPEPVRSLLESLGQRSSQLSQLQMRETLSAEVRAQVGEFCSRAVAGRYPLDRNATAEVTPADFSTLFGPGGKLDAMTKKLEPFVDQNTKTWSFRKVDGTGLGADVGTLPQFQNAQAIRETFFSQGAGPSMRLDFIPVEMDAGISQVTINVNGQVVLRYAHGPVTPSSVQWSGQAGTGQVRVEVTPSGTGITTTGPWALFRLFEWARIEPGRSPERFRATFDFDGRKAVFDVIAGSVRNPLRLHELKDFSCPQGL